MKRREFVRFFAGSAVGAGLGLPMAATAQPARLHRVGALILGNADADAFRTELRTGLAKAGYVEGRNVLLDIRSAEGQVDRLPNLAAELVAAKVDVLIALYTPCVRAAQQATREIPIVAIIANAVETGFMASLARPGGNITGVSMMAAEAHGKCVEVFSELLPSVKKIAALGNAGDPFMPLFLEKVQLGGRATGREILPVSVRSADEIDGAIVGVRKSGAGALVMQGSLPSRIVADVALKRRVPAATFTRSFVDVGGLLSYGPNSLQSYQRCVHFVAKILHGSKPADLPAEQPTHFELVINLKTAKALGVSVPAGLLVRADDVIR